MRGKRMHQVQARQTLKNEEVYLKSALKLVQRAKKIRKSRELQTKLPQVVQGPMVQGLTAVDEIPLNLLMFEQQMYDMCEVQMDMLSRLRELVLICIEQIVDCMDQRPPDEDSFMTDGRLLSI